MTDSIPKIELGLGDDLARVIILDETAAVDSLSARISTVPELLNPDHALQLAKAVNHMAAGSAFDVISDLVAFEA